MHKLSYRLKWRFLLDRGYEFLVDGTPLLDMVEVHKNSSIVPLGLSGERCPGFPEFAKREGRMIFGVCSCGEWGCGVDHCHMSIGEKTVLLDDFHSRKTKERLPLNLEIDRSNFDEVISELKAKGIQWRQYIDRYVAAKQQDGSAAIQKVLLEEMRNGLSNDESLRAQTFRLIEQLLAESVENLKNPMLPKYHLLFDGNAVPELKRLLQLNRNG